MPRTITPPVTYTIADAAGEAEVIACELRDELQSWFDNLPEPFQNGTRGDALQEAIDQLSEVADCAVDIPSCLSDGPEPPTFDHTPLTKKRQSRADRCAVAVDLLRGAAACAREWADERRSKSIEQEELLDAGKVEAEQEAKARARVDWLVSVADEAELYADEVETQADTLENVQFPGMFG